MSFRRRKSQDWKTANSKFWRHSKKCLSKSRNQWKKFDNQNGVYLLREDGTFMHGANNINDKVFASKLFIIDPSDLKTHHIIFDTAPKNGLGSFNCIWDIISKKALDTNSVNNLSVCSADLIQAVIDSDYFIKQVAKCQEEKVKSNDTKIAEEAHMINERKKEEDNVEREFLKSCSPSEYLKRTVFPHLIPGLSAIDKERPNDPLAFLALHLLEHKETINEIHELTR